jgi:hypothetical protein
MTKRIHLVTTGDAELEALGPALMRVFPNVEFSVQKVDGFTSARLSAPSENASRAQDIVDAMLAAIDIGENSEPADYAVALDDLELENEDQVEVVIEHVRHAVKLCIKEPSEVEVISRGSRRRFRHLAGSGSLWEQDESKRFRAQNPFALS